MKRTTVVVAMVLAVVVHFWTKAALLRLHVPGLRSDPCDAVNVAAVLVMCVALVRGACLVIRRSRQRQVPVAEAIIAAMLMSFVAELITVLRHFSSMVDGRSRISMLLLPEGAVAVFALWVLAQHQREHGQAGNWKLLALSFAGSVALLLLCPEWPDARNTPLWHLATVALGFILLLGITRQALLWLSADGIRERKLLPGRGERLSILLGVFLLCSGLCVTTSPRAMLLMAVSGGLLLTYAFLAVPLRLSVTE